MVKPKDCHFDDTVQSNTRPTVQGNTRPITRQHCRGEIASAGAKGAGGDVLKSKITVMNIFPRVATPWLPSGFRLKYNPKSYPLIVYNNRSVSLSMLKHINV